VRLGHELFRRGAMDLLGGACEPDGREHQTLLRAVVQIALEPAPGLVTCHRDVPSGARRAARWGVGADEPREAGAGAVDGVGRGRGRCVAFSCPHGWA
jgi:hypothetical protein